MVSLRLTPVVALALLLVLQTPGSAQQGSSPPHSIKAGERLFYQLFWPRDLPAGVAELEVEDASRQVGAPAWRFRVRVRSTGLIADFYRINHEYSSYAEAHTLNSLQFDQNLRKGQRHRVIQVRFDQERRRARKNPSGEEMTIPADCKDPISAFYEVRRTDWQKVESRQLALNDGRKNIVLDIQVSGRGEKVTTAAGSFLTTKLKIVPKDETGRPAGPEVTAWLTQDKQIPVMAAAPLLVGTLRAELRALP